MSFSGRFVLKNTTPGLPYMLGASLCFSLMTLFVKIAGQRLPPFEIVLARSFITLIFSFAGLRVMGLSPWGHRKGLLILRGVFGFVALCCIYYAVTKLPLADATVIQYSNPIFTAILAAFFLKEQFTLREGIGILVSMAGVILVARPSFIFGSLSTSVSVFAIGIALLGALFSSEAYVTVRKLKDTEHPLTIIFYFPLVSTLASIPLALPTAILPTPYEWFILIVGVGVTAQTGQYCLTRGLQLEPAGRAMALSYLQIVFAALWGILFLSEYPSPATLAGAFLVIVGTWITARKTTDEQKTAEAIPLDVS